MSDAVYDPDEFDPDELDPVFAPWDGRRVPVTLLGGYLGSGKTTVINEVLRRTDVPVAVLVNDAGAVNIDAALIERHDGDTLELTGGCVCCSLKDGFLEAFDQLRRRPAPPEFVIVELSGLADPAPAAALATGPGFAVDGVVVLVDLDQFLDFAEAKSVVADSLNAQIPAADVLLLTKRDLVDEARVKNVTDHLTQLAPGVPVLTVESAHSAAGLVGLAARRPPGTPPPSPSLFDQYRTSLIPLGGTVRRTDLERIVDGLGEEVIRAKGIVQVETGEILLVQVVGRRRTIEPLPMAESQATTDLVVISHT